MFGMMSIDDVQLFMTLMLIGGVPKILFLGYKINSYYIFYPVGKLVHLVSCTFEVQRLRGDLIEVFRILKGYENIDQEVFSYMSQSSLRGHSLKSNKKRVT